MRLLIALGIAVSILFTIWACSPTETAEEAPRNFTVTCTKPVLEPQEGYPFSQTRDNVTIALSQEPINHRLVYERELKQVFELFKNSEGNKYKVSERPHHFNLEPDNLRLKLDVTNNLSHVLRFNGAVLTMAVDGKNVPISERTQNELLQAVMTPYTTMTVPVEGPALEHCMGASTLQLSIYDVITEVDAANNPTKRTNFEWIFALRPESVSETHLMRTREERMTEIQASRYAKYSE